MFLPFTAAFLAGLLIGSFLPFFPLSGAIVLLAMALVVTRRESLFRIRLAEHVWCEGIAHEMMWVWKQS